MKRFLSMCIIAACCCGVSVAQNMRQVELKSDNNLNYYYYHYNAINRVDSIYQEITSDSYSSYRLFTYDEHGNNINEKRYQMAKEMIDYLFTDYVNYTYDENNNILTRKNYNLDMWGGSGEYILGGLYVYEYDYANRLSKRNLYWDEEETRLSETVVYTYNDKGLLASETRQTMQFDMWLEDYKAEYEYDAQDRIAKIQYFALDYMTGNLIPDSYRVYEYDGDGNLVRTSDYLADGVINQKNEYTYRTDIESANTTFPVTNDDINSVFYASKNVVSENTIYMRDLRKGELVYIDKETWVYEEFDPAAGIKDVRNDAEMSILSLSSDKVELGNVAMGEKVRIFNASGNMLGSAAYNGSIDISDLPSGVYMIATKNNCVKINK